jgi:hypothetical protein
LIILPIPKIATSGGLITGVKISVLIIPKLVKVKVEPLISFSEITPFLVSPAIFLIWSLIALKFHLSLFRMTGTINPFTVSTAIPILIALYDYFFFVMSKVSIKLI